MTIIHSWLRPALKKVTNQRLASGSGRFSPIRVDIDHYTSEQSKEYTKQGKYSVQTYNQISTKVWFFWPLTSDA